MYALSGEQRAAFARDGYCVLRGFCSPAEVAATASIFEQLAGGALPVAGKDRGVHTPGLLNVTAFSLYHALEALGDDEADAACGGKGVLARIDERGLDVTTRVYGDLAREAGMGSGASGSCAGASAESAAGGDGGNGGGGTFARDYEQLLRKLPAQPGALFPPHQDMHYWPKSASNAFDTRTVTLSVAVNDADETRGCLWVLPGSHCARAMYPGCTTRRADSRPDGGGVIELQMLPEDVPRRVFLPLAAGDATIHDEYLVHGSEGNESATESRDTLILAYRAKTMIAFERALGFRHSYNDGEEVLRNVRETIFP
jgi:hypothetical protein